VGGESLYRQVQTDATAPDAPDRRFFERVLTGRKVIVMLDEIAQYAARLEAARPNGSEQLAAFLLALHGYARTHSGIAVVLTLASQSDAFARQTGRLIELISAVRGVDITEDTVLGMAQQAVHGIRSVVARDAVTVVPVQAAEISRVLALASSIASTSRRPWRRRTPTWICIARALLPSPTMPGARIFAKQWWRTTPSIRRSSTI
jgi:hypothetical protein